MQGWLGGLPAGGVAVVALGEDETVEGFHRTAKGKSALIQFIRNDLSNAKKGKNLKKKILSHSVNVLEFT